jgi:hypothetical protein
MFINSGSAYVLLKNTAETFLEKEFAVFCAEKVWLTIIGTEYKYTCAQLQYEYKLTMNSGFCTF